jgi:hypothetical protein
MRRIVALLAVALLAACNRTTGTLSEENQKRFEAEGVLHKAVDVVFRRTKPGDGSRTRWDDGDASIVVTRQSVVIHSGDRFLLEITPRSTGEYKVSREKDRVTIQGGRGQSRVSWSFRPPDDAEAWTEDVRAVIRNAAGNPTDHRTRRPREGSGRE